MRVQIFLPLTILVSVALLGLTNLRNKETDREKKQSKFQDIKLRVSIDVLHEYVNVRTVKWNALEKAQAEQKALLAEVNVLQTKSDKGKQDVGICQNEQKMIVDEVASAEMELKNLQAKISMEINSWKKEVETIKKQLAGRSSVCDFVKKDSAEGRKLCGDAVEPPKKEEPKKEEPKKEEPKKEEPKKEEPKPEAPKIEEPKPEAPKKEETKKEESKSEAPKKEELKPEAPKKEEPKKEEPKPEVPKKEELKQEAPKKEEPKKEEPKQEAPKKEEPKKEEPKPEVPKKEEPIPEAPKKDEPKPEVPNKEEPKKEESKQEATK